MNIMQTANSFTVKRLRPILAMNYLQNSLFHDINMRLSCFIFVQSMTIAVAF